MGKHWHIYRTITPADFPLSAFSDQAVQDSEFTSAKIIALSELSWLHSGRKCIFVPADVLAFLDHTDYTVSPQDLAAVSPLVVSWDPRSRLARKSCLVIPVQDSIMLHWEHVDGKGTNTAVIPLGDHIEDGPEFGEEARSIQRAVFGLLVYMQAFPEMVEAGFPQDLKERVRRTSGVKPVIIGLHPKARAASRAHLRRGHFRSLGHEKFKRNPDGSIRIVYVHPSIVGDLDPYLVKNMSQ